MTHWKRVLTGCGAVVLLVTPAWGHPSPTPHAHGNELTLLLASGFVLGAVLLLRRFRSKLG